MKQGYFITGTDTGAGKTLTASSLIRHFAGQGLRSIGMKPVAAGCDLVNNEYLSEDVFRLMDASNVAMPRHLVNPYAFAPAVAPHIAAGQAGIDIRIEVIEQAFQQLSAMADVVVVEGVGGFRVPLSATLDTADLAQVLNLPVILVAGMRLGCINHALLTVEAIRSRGLVLAGWVANQIDPDMASVEENFNALEQRIPAPCLARVGWDEQPAFTI